HFKLRRWLTLDAGRIGDRSELWGPEVMRRLQLDADGRLGAVALRDSGDPTLDPLAAGAHSFTLFVQRRDAACALEQQPLERIVELAKPAHTAAAIQVVEPRFRVGVQAFIGVDSVIGSYPSGVLEGAGHLGVDTVIGPSWDERAGPTIRVG